MKENIENNNVEQEEVKEKAKKPKKLTAKEIEENLKAQLLEKDDKYIRLAAEFDNYRRRTAKERMDLIKSAGEDVVKGLLVILDDYTRSLDSIKDLKEDDPIRVGIELIYNKFIGYLKSLGVNAIECENQELNTDFHEAIAQFPVEDEEKKNKIIEVVQQGYTMNEKVIRFAKVVVGI